MAVVPKQLKILLVEDEPIVMIVHRKRLEMMGYTPDTAEHGEQALTMSANGYDVILMDLGLPYMDGIEIAAEIRRRESLGIQERTCIIALTCYPREEVEEKCLAAGMDKVATKPIDDETLQKLLTDVCK